jgi:hypothetical protein
MTNGQKVKTQRERQQAKAPAKKGEASNLKAVCALGTHTRVHVSSLK